MNHDYFYGASGSKDNFLPECYKKEHVDNVTE